MRNITTSPQPCLVIETNIQRENSVQVFRLHLVPDYVHILHNVNRESAVPIDEEAIINFTKSFLSVAQAVGYNCENAYVQFDPYVKDIQFLLSIGVQKVHQAFTIREYLIEWIHEMQNFSGFLSTRTTTETEIGEIVEA